MTQKTIDAMAAALRWVDRKLNLHKNYLDTFKDHTDSHVLRQLRHKTKQTEVLETCREALAAYNAEKDNNGWMPIETAPIFRPIFCKYKDGSVHILVKNNHGQFRYAGDGAEYFNPSEWKPIEPPKETL